MESQNFFKSHEEKLEGCGCCELEKDGKDGNGEVYGCTDRGTVLTHREEQVLRRIRETRQKAKDLKARIDLLTGNGSSEKNEALRELANLRALRSDLEVERLAAAEERMRLLGHA
jgi:hypothetical protein